MTQEKFKEASEIQEEIDRLDLLIKEIEYVIINDPEIGSDYGYLVHLMGVDNMLDCMRTRKKMLEKEFEEL